MGAERIVNNGSTHVDFELNKNPFKTWSDGLSKANRSNGDLLISLDYSNGGSDPDVTVYQFSNVTTFASGQTATVTDITKTAAVHSATNFVDLTPDAGFGYTIPSFEFAEASIDLRRSASRPACPGLSSGFIRTRSGDDPASSELKDKVAPFPIDLNNCGKVTIVKDAVPNSARTSTTRQPAARLSNFSLDDDNDPTLSDTKTFNQVVPGDYTVTEARSPVGS